MNPFFPYALQASAPVRIWVPCEGPPGVASISFNTRFVNSILEIKNLHKDLSDVTDPRFSAQNDNADILERYLQGNSSSASELSETVVPRWKKSSIDWIITHKENIDVDNEFQQKKRVYFHLSEYHKDIDVDRDDLGNIKINAPQSSAEEVVIRYGNFVLLAHSFPFNRYVSDQNLRENFFNALGEDLKLALNSEELDPMCSSFFIPPLGSQINVEEIWAHALIRAYPDDFELPDIDVLSEFIIRTWTGAGGGKSVKSLSSLLRRDITRYFGYNTRLKTRLSGNKNIYEGIIRGDLDLVSLGAKPNPRREREICTLLSLSRWKANAFGAIPKDRSPKIESFIDEKCFIPYDARFLRSYLSLVNERKRR